MLLGVNWIINWKLNYQPGTSFFSSFQLVPYFSTAFNNISSSSSDHFPLLIFGSSVFCHRCMHWSPVRSPKKSATLTQLWAPNIATPFRSFSSSSASHTVLSISLFRVRWKRCRHWIGVRFVPSSLAIFSHSQLLKRFASFSITPSSSFVNGVWLISGCATLHHCKWQAW